MADRPSILIVTTGDVVEWWKPFDRKGRVRPYEMGISSPGHQQHFLGGPVGVEPDVVLDHEGIALVLVVQGGFHEDEDAVVPKDLDPLEAGAGCAIHVDAEGGRAASDQSDVHTYGVGVWVAGNEAFGHGPDGGENGIEQHGIPAEVEFDTPILGELGVLAAAREHEE